MAEHQERRAHDRHGLALNRSIEAELVCHQQTVTEHLYIIDLSVAGIRLNSTNPLPDSYFTLDASLTGVAERLEGRRLKLGLKKIWSQFLSGGTWVSGLELVEATACNLEVLSELLSFSSGPGGRGQFRLAQIQKVKFSSPSGLKWRTATCIDLSSRGLCVIIDGYLARGDVLAIRLSPPRGPDIQALAEVAWNREYFGRDMAVGLKFTEISESAARALQSYIDQEARRS